MKTSISLWVPAVFAAFLSAIALFGVQFNPSVWQSAFFSFLVTIQVA